VYTIGILDFVFEEDRNDPEKYRYDIKLLDIATHKVFYDKLTFIYLELPKFTKTLDQLETRFEKWLYAIKNLDRLDRVPDALREQVFEKFFAVAEIANFNRDEVLKYEDSLKYYRDLKNSFDTAREEGREEGIVTVARNLLDVLDDGTIAAKTGMSEEAVAALRKG
jgi:predicted transposase/invertase (TIGR01784 family)